MTDLPAILWQHIGGYAIGQALAEHSVIHQNAYFCVQVC